MKVGDKMVIYVIPKKIGGLYEISNVNYTGSINLPDGKYPYRIALKARLVPKEMTEVTAKTIGDLSIFRHTLRWGTVLMGRSIVQIKQADYNKIKRLIRDAETEQDL